MAAMHEFLRGSTRREMRALYAGLDETWNARARRLNQRLRDEGLPVRVANLSSIWTVCYTQPSRYNWMLQYYLRAEGLALSWVGTGRLIFSLNYTEADFDAVADRFVAAAKAMQRDGWWWCDGATTNKSIKRRLLREMIAHRFSSSGGGATPALRSTMPAWTLSWPQPARPTLPNQSHSPRSRWSGALW